MLIASTGSGDHAETLAQAPDMKNQVESAKVEAQIGRAVIYQIQQDYPAAIAMSYEGDKAPLAEQRAELDKRTKKIEDWLAELGAGPGGKAGKPGKAGKSGKKKK